ncbi:hypothetical protein D3C71_689630 [compost metagenome]
MRELDHDRRALFMHGVGHFPDPRDDLILVDEQIVEDGRAVPGDSGGAGRHCERNAALRPLHRVGAVTPLRHAVLGISGFVRRDDDAVAQREVF